MNRRCLFVATCTFAIAPVPATAQPLRNRLILALEQSEKEISRLSVAGNLNIKKTGAATLGTPAYGRKLPLEDVENISWAYSNGRLYYAYPSGNGTETQVWNGKAWHVAADSGTDITKGVSPHFTGRPTLIEDPVYFGYMFRAGDDIEYTQIDRAIRSGKLPAITLEGKLIRLSSSRSSQNYRDSIDLYLDPSRGYLKVQERRIRRFSKPLAPNHSVSIWECKVLDSRLFGKVWVPTHITSARWWEGDEGSKYGRVVKLENMREASPVDPMFTVISPGDQVTSKGQSFLIAEDGSLRPVQAKVAKEEESNFNRYLIAGAAMVVVIGGFLLKSKMST